MICPYFTSVSLILLEGKPGELTTPRIEYLTDAKHVPRDEGAWIQSKPDK